MGGGDLVSEGAQGWGKTEAGDRLRLGTEIGGGDSGYSWQRSRWGQRAVALNRLRIAKAMRDRAETWEDM